MTRLRHHISSLLILFFLCFFSRTEAQTNDDAKIQYYNNLATISINKFRFEKAEAYCDSALQIHANAATYYLRAYIDNYRRNWDGAIENGNRSIELDSNNLQAYSVLFNAYYNTQKWDDALNVGEKAGRADPTASTSENIKFALASQQSKNISRLILLACFLIVSIIFTIPLFRHTKKKITYLTSATYPNLSLLILVTAAVSCFLYITFFALSKWIWSLNPPVAPSALTPFIRVFISEHDGVESFFLYVTMFIDILVSFLITIWLIKLQPDKLGFLLISIILIIISGYYFLKIGFSPPLPDIHAINETQFPVVVIVIGLLSILLFYLYKKSRLVVSIIILLLIAFVSLISAYPTSKVDLMYVLAPALRLADGFKVSEIYFQYDLLLSFLGSCWIKFLLPLDWFSYLGQVSYFLFFTGAFIFAQRFFNNKALSVFFILALLIVRYYSVWEAGVSIIQSTPLRLDLWLILLWLVYLKGAYHWLTGLSLAFLLIFHRNLGLLYTASYFVLIALLFAIDVLSLPKEKRKNISTFIAVFQKHFRLNRLNLLLIGISVITCFLLFGDFFSRSGVEYRKYGIGMLPIERNSFYWYIPVLLSSASILLYSYRNKLTIKYFTSGIFIILLAIANSMYFFGRSHENNILNISGILVLALFVCFDLIIFSVSQETVKNPQVKSKKTFLKKSNPGKTKVALLLPFLFILLCSYYYANRITEKISNQVDNLSKFQFVYPLDASIDTGAVKEITHHSSKVYFLDFHADFYFYYYGKYTPQGYYNPSATWIFKKDFINFLQTLLNDHYYIVMLARKFDSFSEFLSYLDYNSSIEKNNLITISKEPIPHLLSNDGNELFHIAMKDSSSIDGIEHAGLVLTKNFTIEALVRPVGNQAPNATILSNWNNFAGFPGITLQANGSVPGQYMFRCVSGSIATQNIIFALENNQWHYLTIGVSDSSLKVYDWGRLIADSKVTTSIQNSDEPLTIGNRPRRDAHFNGFIREIKIANGLNESGIPEKAAQLSKKMNTSSY